MARIVVTSLEEFLKAMRALANPRTHVLVTDGYATVELVPRTTSRHRHYIKFLVDEEEEISKILVEAEKQHYTIIKGSVQEVIA